MTRETTQPWDTVTAWPGAEPDGVVVATVGAYSRGASEATQITHKQPLHHSEPPDICQEHTCAPPALQSSITEQQRQGKALVSERQRRIASESLSEYSHENLYR